MRFAGPRLGVLTCTRVYYQSVLEPFSFTEDKRKEVRGNIEDRVRLLEDEHVSLFFFAHARLGRTSQKLLSMTTV